MNSTLFDTYIFILAIFIGFQLISKVPSILHTPLMSGTNAIHGVILVGAIALASTSTGWLGVSISTVAVVLGTINVVGGFVVTDRILGMFKRKPTTPTSGGKAASPTSGKELASATSGREGSGHE